MQFIQFSVSFYHFVCILDLPQYGIMPFGAFKRVFHKPDLIWCILPLQEHFGTFGDFRHAQSQPNHTRYLIFVNIGRQGTIYGMLICITVMDKMNRSETYIIISYTLSYII